MGWDGTGTIFLPMGGIPRCDALQEVVALQSAGAGPMLVAARTRGSAVAPVGFAGELLLQAYHLR